MSKSITIRQAIEFKDRLGRMPTLQDIQREFKANYRSAVGIRDVIKSINEGNTIAKSQQAPDATP